MLEYSWKSNFFIKNREKKTRIKDQKNLLSEGSEKSFYINNEL